MTASPGNPQPAGKKPPCSDGTRAHHFLLHGDRPTAIGVCAKCSLVYAFLPNSHATHYLGYARSLPLNLSELSSCLMDLEYCQEVMQEEMTTDHSFIASA